MAAAAVLLTRAAAVAAAAAAVNYLPEQRRVIKLEVRRGNLGRTMGAFVQA
jgi:hypothetical protein